MQIIDTHTGPAISLAAEESLSKDYLRRILHEHGQFLAPAGSYLLDAIFESLEEHDGADLTTDLVQA